MKDNESVFHILNKINVDKMIEKKRNLKYLSWAHAWKQIKDNYPEADYSIWKDNLNRPYIYDEKLGYMVFTNVTIGSLDYEMWLFVMDSSNKAMKDEIYTYETNYGKKTVEAATMFDINKTIMRCLVKNISMFGLGLYIYEGDDLPVMIEKTDSFNFMTWMDKNEDMARLCRDHSLTRQEVKNIFHITGPNKQYFKTEVNNFVKKNNSDNLFK